MRRGARGGIHPGENVAADRAAGIRVRAEGDLRLLPDRVEGGQIFRVVVR
jgi:hypothetical protein